MAKRHQFGTDFLSKVRRMQELIMSHSGVDEFYEIIRIILAKYFSETRRFHGLPSLAECNSLLATNSWQISDIIDGALKIQIPERVFEEIRTIFGEVNLHSQDFHALDTAFEQLTSRTYKSDKGQFFTPRHVIDMCVEIIDPKPGELICDPACGSGAFLKSAHSYTTSHYGQAGKLVGFDYSHRACQVAKLVSLMGAGAEIDVHQLDSLALPQRNLFKESSPTIEAVMGDKFFGFDAIITNPPFAGDVGLEAYSSSYDIASLYRGRLERDLLFVERCIRLLKIGGRLAIVLPDNKISSKSFSDFRLWIGKNALLKGVVSLHRYTFLPYTSQKAAVLFLVKNAYHHEPYDSTVRFYRSDLSGKTSNGSYVYLDGADPNKPPYLSLNHDLATISSDLRSHLCEA